MERPHRGHCGVDDAGRDAVVGDVEEAARTCRGADERYSVPAREGEVDGWDGERGGRRG